MATIAPPKLSVVNEGVEKNPEMTASQSSMSSKGSTLKNGDFEVDSLEQEVVLFSTNPSTPTTPHAHIPPKGAMMMNGVPSRAGGGMLLPPPPRNPNLVVNYADPHGSATLSPIWNQYFRTDSETSTNSEYITSYVGKLTPLPNILSPDYSNKVVGAPPQPGGRVQGAKKKEEGQQSSGSDNSREPSSGESGGEGGGASDAKDGCLKWKRGRLLGKGAYGKVWEGLLSSARMIAVKEVELDTDSHDRAQMVRNNIDYIICLLLFIVSVYVTLRNANFC